MLYIFIKWRDVTYLLHSNSRAFLTGRLWFNFLSVTTRCQIKTLAHFYQQVTRLLRLSFFMLHFYMHHNDAWGAICFWWTCCSKLPFCSCISQCYHVADVIHARWRNIHSVKASADGITARFTARFLLTETCSAHIEVPSSVAGPLMH
jgi:hypothetical protein